MKDFRPFYRERMFVNKNLPPSTVKLQWLEHLLDRGNLFDIWVVRATEVNRGARSGSK